MEDDEEPVIDLTGEDNTDNILKVFELLGPNDKIVVKKDESGNINIKDNETNKEYMVVGESEEDTYDDLMEFESEEDYSNEDVKSIVDKVFANENTDESEVVYEVEMDEEDDMDFEDDSNEMDEDEEMDLDQVMESFKVKVS